QEERRRQEPRGKVAALTRTRSDQRLLILILKTKLTPGRWRRRRRRRRVHRRPRHVLRQNPARRLPFRHAFTPDQVVALHLPLAQQLFEPPVVKRAMLLAASRKKPLGHVRSPKMGDKPGGGILWPPSGVRHGGCVVWRRATQSIFEPGEPSKCVLCGAAQCNA